MFNAVVAQLVEHALGKGEVVSPILTGGTILVFYCSVDFVLLRIDTRFILRGLASSMR